MSTNRVDTFLTTRKCRMISSIANVLGSWSIFDMLHPILENGSGRTCHVAVVLRWTIALSATARALRSSWSKGQSLIQSAPPLLPFRPGGSRRILLLLCDITDEEKTPELSQFSYSHLRRDVLLVVVEILCYIQCRPQNGIGTI